MARARGALGLTLAVALAALASGATGATAKADCTFWAALRGNNANPGSEALPVRTVSRLLALLQPGQTGCLEPRATFVERVRIDRGGAPGAPIRLRTAPGGRRAVLRGAIVVGPSAPNVIVATLVIAGDGSRRRAIVLVQGSNVALIRNDVSGPGYLNANVPCILLLGAAGTLVDGNTIHNCVRATAPGTVYAPGVYVASARQTTISNNFVYHTLGDALVLAPDAQATRVSRNVVDGNVSGIYLGGNERDASSGNLIVDNVISNSGRYNVHSAWSGRVGRRNLVTRNCIWRGIRANLAGRGFTATKNRFANPRYVDRRRGLAMRPSSPCFGKRPLSYLDATTDLGTPYPTLGAFVVSYRLRALPSRVQVVRLTLEKLLPGARVSLSCARGCRLSEHLTAGRSGTARSRRLPGRWLARGAVVEVRARVGGWVGSYARITVTGLPRGVSIGHACLPPVGPQAPVPCSRYR